MLSVGNFEVVHSQIQRKTITMHIHTQHFVELFKSPVFIVFDVAFWKPVSFFMLAIVDRAIHLPYFSAMTVYDDPASIDLIIFSFLLIVSPAFVCLEFSAILCTTRKFHLLRQHNYSTCAIKPRLCSDTEGFI